MFLKSTRQAIMMLLAFVAMPLLAQQQEHVQNLRLWHSPERTRVVFDVSDHVQYSLFQLDNPKRLVVDLENTAKGFSLPSVQVNQHIEKIHFGHPKKYTLRVVFTLKQTLDHVSFVLNPNELYGHRLVVDLSAANNTGPSAQGNKEPLVNNIDSKSSARADESAAKKSEPSARTDRSVANKETSKLATNRQPIIIAIDAGHGGEDPGARGYRGTKEKKVTLSIAKALKEVIDRDPRMSSFLVRGGDYFIKLHHRRQIAKKKNADLFISIHADAFHNRNARGFSVFALSERGATSAMARALAAKENASDRIGGVSLADKDDVLAKVLVDLSMTNTIEESVNLGSRVLKELGKLGKLHSRRVEQAGFAVLKTADVPSLLIETGFITNPEEERRLRSSSYQKQVARAIYTAIDNYFNKTPHYANGVYKAPSVAQGRSTGKKSSKTSSSKKSTPKPARPRYHKVRVGDSLSKIADKYGTTVREIKRLNKLKSNVAMLGVRLKIPAGGSGQSTSKRQVSKPAYHTVRSGDSLSKVSAKYNITMTALRRINNLKSDMLYKGQRIKLSQGAVSKQQSRKTNQVRYHKVRRGDTLSEIADHYGVSSRAIMRANKMRRSTVMLGQKLKIPN